MRKITMTMLAAPAMIVALAVGMVGCNSLGTGTTDAARVAVGIGFETYASGYQPVLALYAKLPYCGDPAVPPCKDRALYKKLYEADATVAKCAAAAQVSLASESPDFVAISACVQSVEASKLVFASPLAATANTPVPAPKLKGTTP